MEREEVLLRERIHHDPVFHQAKKVANAALEQRHGTRIDSHLVYLRGEINNYRSSSMRLQFLDALRAELLLLMEIHREGCKRKDCGRESVYAELVYVIKDELEVLNPVISARDVRESINHAEAQELVNIKNELLDAIQEGNALLIEAQLTVLNGVVEEIDGLWQKMAYGKKDWSSLVIAYLTEKAIDKGLDKAIVDPAVERINELLG